MIAEPDLLSFARKLAQRRPLAPADEEQLARILRRNLAGFGPRSALVEAGEAPGAIQIVLDGWACSYRTGRNGRRQILAFHLPGDVCDFDVFMMRAADAQLEALDGVQVARLSRTGLNELTRAHPAITAGLWWDSLVAASIQREWLVSIGQRNARQRVAHLLCELFTRLKVVGRTRGEAAADLPLTQVDIGDACGMTVEHANRTLRNLRDAGLCTVHERVLEIADWPGLVECGGFHPAYLHFDREIEAHAQRFGAPADAPVPLVAF